MSTSDRTLSQVRAILSKLDRSIDEARERRTHRPAAPAPVAAAAPIAAREAAPPPPPTTSPFGRAQAIPSSRATAVRPATTGDTNTPRFGT